MDILSGYTDEFYHASGATFNRTSLQLRNTVEATATVGVYCQPSTFWKTPLMREMGGVNEELHCSMDYDLWLRYLLAHGQSRVLKLDAQVARYRHHDHSKTNTLSPRFYEETTAIFDRLNSVLGAPASFLEGRVPKAIGEPPLVIDPGFRPEYYFGCYCERRARIERDRRPAAAFAWICQALRYPPGLTVWRLRMAIRLLFLKMDYKGPDSPAPWTPEFNLRILMGSITLAVLLLFCALVFGGHSKARNIVSGNFGNTQQPRVAVSPNGTIYIVFVQGETIYLTTSTDHGANFSTPTKVATVPRLQVGNRRGPHIAVTDDAVLITEPAQNLLSTVSEDQGKTWSPAMPINDHAGSAAEGLQDVTALPDGGFYAVWLDSRTGHPQVEGARLDPHANAWGRNLAVYTSPEKSVCECCQPSVAADSAGRVVVMWRNLLEGDRDLYFAESHDRGGTFSAAAKLGNDSWPANFCPMDGGDLTVDSDAGIVTVWRRKGDVFLDQPGQPEVKVGEGTQPVVVRVQNDTYCIWQNDGQIIVSRDQGPGPSSSRIRAPSPPWRDRPMGGRHFWCGKVRRAATSPPSSTSCPDGITMTKRTPIGALPRADEHSPVAGADVHAEKIVPAGKADHVIVGLELMRGLACLEVVGSHILWSDPAVEGNRLYYHFFKWGYQAVMIFFVLSGLVIARAQMRKRRTPGRYLVARFERIVPLYLVAIVFSVLVGLYVRQAVKFFRRSRPPRFYAGCPGGNHAAKNPRQSRPLVPELRDVVLSLLRRGDPPQRAFGPKRNWSPGPFRP